MCRYFKLKKCITKVSLAEEIAVDSIDKWPDRLSKPSARASLMDGGASLFEADTQKWIKRVSYYKTSLGVKLGARSPYFHVSSRFCPQLFLDNLPLI